LTAVSVLQARLRAEAEEAKQAEAEAQAGKAAAAAAQEASAAKRGARRAASEAALREARAAARRGGTAPSTEIAPPPREASKTSASQTRASQPAERAAEKAATPRAAVPRAAPPIAPRQETLAASPPPQARLAQRATKRPAAAPALRPVERGIAPPVARKAAAPAARKAVLDKGGVKPGGSPGGSKKKVAARPVGRASAPPKQSKGIGGAVTTLVDGALLGGVAFLALSGPVKKRKEAGEGGSAREPAFVQGSDGVWRDAAAATGRPAPAKVAAPAPVSLGDDPEKALRELRRREEEAMATLADANRAPSHECGPSRAPACPFEPSGAWGIVGALRGAGDPPRSHRGAGQKIAAFPGHRSPTRHIVLRLHALIHALLRTPLSLPAASTAQDAAGDGVCARVD